MRRGLLTAVAAAALLGCASAHAELVVNISKSQQRVAVIVNGSEAYRWPVSTGRRGYATPSGVYHPERLERHWYSRKYENSPMPWSVFFHGGYAVHGTLEVSHLGRPVSHGCVRLKPEQAYTLYSLIQREGLDVTLEYAVVLNNWSVMMQSAGQHRTSAALSERALCGTRPDGIEHCGSLDVLGQRLTPWLR